MLFYVNFFFFFRFCFQLPLTDSVLTPNEIFNPIHSFSTHKAMNVYQKYS